MIDLAMLALLAAAFVGAALYVRFCASVTGQSSPASDKAS